MKHVTLLLAIFSLSIPTHPQSHKRKVSDSEVKAIIQAVEDEIYDYGYQKQFFQKGKKVETSPSTSSIRVRIYVEPELDVNEQSGRVIYRLMPNGEVIRDFVVRTNGLVLLSGDPQNGFPPTQESSTKTAYMDSDEVRQMKRDWLKAFFVVDGFPGYKRIQEAAQRQKLRTGFSDREYQSGQDHPN
jgi:hypothetical protein